MKTTIQFIIIALVICLSACESNLEEKPMSFFEESNSYNNARDATSAINGVYATLASEGYYGMNIINLSDVSGEECYIREDGNNSVVEIDKCIFTSDNTNFDNFYTSVYLTINRANRVIAYVPNINMDTKMRDQIVGEAKFLRALAYFDLVRSFGDVPLIKNVSNDVINVKIPRTPAELVYALIINDLTDSEQVLPTKYTSAGEVGRATVGAVKSLLAKVYLTQKNWAKAAEKAKEVIDLKMYSLVPDYKDIFLPEKKNGAEHIFSVQFSCTQQVYGSRFAKSFSMQFSYPVGLGGGAYQSTEYHENSYKEDDYRKKVTIIRQKKLADGTLVESRTGPFSDKYWDPNPCGTDAARNNFIILRYADVLLMYAEALNELKGLDPAAFASVNQVRARARNGNEAASPANLTGLTQGQLRDAILQERSWELCFEGHRRWDLLRTGKYLELMKKTGIIATEKHLLYPIPLNEIDVNLSLTQNPGY